MIETEKKLKELIKSVSTKIHELYPGAEVYATVDIPTDKTKADLVITGAFALGKSLHKSPPEVASEICEALSQDSDLAKYFSFSASASGFVNLELQDKFLCLLINDVITAGEEYGRNKVLENQTWVVEHTSPNPNKAMHLGHLRNNLTGIAIAKLAEFCGARVIYDAVDNNRGIAIAKAMWGFLVTKRRDGKRMEDINYWYGHQNEWLQPDDVHQKPDHFVGDCYLSGSDEFKANQLTESAVRDLVIKWEDEDPIVWALWEKILGYAHEGIELTLKRLGSRWDNVWHEHEHYREGKKLVEEGLRKGIFQKVEGGAVVTNLSKYALSDTILLKSDGTSLYITQDIALTKLKKDKFKADKLIWIVGPEQTLALKQLFAACEQLGIGRLSEFDHVSYGLVNVQTESGVKKMSSRGGEVILIDELIENVKMALLNSDRGYVDDVAEAIAIAAIKLAVLKPSRTSNLTININNAISLEGDSGAYLLYTYARMKSLLSKSSPDKNLDFSLNEKEHDLVSRLLYFPMIVSNSIKNYSPNQIVDYLFELSHTFNTWYSSEKFITDDKSETNKKMLITLSLLTVFSNAFLLLGVKPLERI